VAGIQYKCGISDNGSIKTDCDKLFCGTNLFQVVPSVPRQPFLGKAQSCKYLLEVSIPEGKRKPLFKADAITVLRGGQRAKA